MVKVHEAALSEKDDQVEFFYNKRHSGYSALRPPGMNASETIQPITVKCQRLDDLVPGEQHIDFLKVDVEGAELSVFRGARRVLTENDPLILFECTLSGLANFKFTADDMFDVLVDDDRYEIFLIRDWLLNREKSLDRGAFKKAMEYPFQAFNFVAQRAK